jgi:rSAM/selenodomain-associated transferase 1
LRVLGVFAKEPRSGQVKTRLAAQTSADWAARVATAFLLDAVQRLARIDAALVLAFTPPAAQSYFAEIAQGQFRLIPQTEGDLGRRMAAFFTEQFHAGAAAAVLVGTDSPTLPLSFIVQAFQELESADVVIGPSTDGGYYLIGCARRVPPVFDGIPWSTSVVLSHTMASLQDPAYRLALLPPWYDVDTLDDWRMLQGHVAAQRRAGVDPAVPHTEQLLRDQEGP